MILSKRVVSFLPIVLLIAALLYFFKPELVFKSNGKMRESGFGTDSEGYKKTLFTFQWILIVSCIIAFCCLNSKTDT